MLIDYYKLIKVFDAQLITLPMYLLLLTVENEFRKEIFPSINEAYNLLNYPAPLPSK